MSDAEQRVLERKASTGDLWAIIAARLGRLRADGPRPEPGDVVTITADKASMGHGNMGLKPWGLIDPDSPVRVTVLGLYDRDLALRDGYHDASEEGLSEWDRSVAWPFWTCVAVVGEPIIPNWTKTYYCHPRLGDVWNIEPSAALIDPNLVPEKAKAALKRGLAGKCVPASTRRKKPTP